MSASQESLWLCKKAPNAALKVLPLVARAGLRYAAVGPSFQR